VLIVGTAIVSQEPNSLLLPDEQPADTVGAEMNAGSVAAERNVAGQFVDLIAERQAGSAPRLQGRTVPPLASTGCGRT